MRSHRVREKRADLGEKKEGQALREGVVLFRERGAAVLSNKRGVEL